MYTVSFKVACLSHTHIFVILYLYLFNDSVTLYEVQITINVR